MIVSNTVGVFSKFIDKSQYPLPSESETAAACVFVSERGEDNVFKFIGRGPKEFVDTFGEINVLKYGQALLNAYRFSLASNNLYAMRVLPNADDELSDGTKVDPATYAHVVFCLARDKDDPEKVTVIPVYFNKNKSTANTIQTEDLKDAPTKFTNVYFTVEDQKVNTNVSEYVKQPITLDDETVNNLQNDEYIKTFFLNPKSISNLDSTITPFIIIYAIGRGEWYNNLEISITKVPNAPGLYNLEVRTTINDQRITLENFVVSFDPSLVDGTGETYFIDHVTKTYSKYIRTFTNKNLIPTLLSKKQVGDKTYTLIDYVLDGTLYVVDSYGMSYPTTYVDFKYGREGDLFVNGLLNKQVYTMLLIKAFQGQYDSRITNKDEIEIDLILDANYDMAVKQQIVKLAQKRSDCFAILDILPAGTVDDIIQIRQTKFSWLNTFLAALYAPFSVIADPVSGSHIKVAPSYHVSYVYPNNDKAGIWKAPAGLNRATLTDILYSLVDISTEPSVIANLLTNQINPIVKKRGVYIFYGNETAQKVSSSLSDINVVRTLLRLDREISKFCDNFLFEDNNPDTWNRVETGVREILASYKRKGALYWYDVEVGATEYEIKTHRMHVNVYVKVMKTVKVINLTFTIKA